MSQNVSTPTGDFRVRTSRRLSRTFTRVPAVQEKKETSWKQKILKIFGLKDDEDDDKISEEEAARRYQIAMGGWKKVRKLLEAIKLLGVEKIIGQRVQTKPQKFWTYSHFVCLPNNPWRGAWEAMMGFMIIYHLVIVPYREFWNDFREGFMIIDYIWDILCLFNIIANFFFAYNKRTKIYKDFKHIFVNYFFGNFVIDVLCIMPYYWMGTEDRDYYWLRFFRFVQLGQALRIMEEFWKTILLKITSNINFTKSLTRIINFVCLMMIIGQLLASIWFSLGKRMQVREGESVTVDSNGVEHVEPIYFDGWVTEILVKKSAGFNDTSDRSTWPTIDKNTEYISSLYWVFTTLSTVGYGDIYGSTTAEYLYNMAVEFIGVFLFAYMMGNINNLIEKLDNDHQEFIEEESELLDQWIMKIDRANPKRRLKPEMIKDIKDFFRTYWQKDHTMVQEEFPFLNQLPLKVRSQLIVHLFSKFIAQFNVFFNSCEEAFINEIVINLVPRKFPKGTEIIKIDQGAKDIYFITKGSVTIGSHDGIEKYLDLPSGSYFGDHLILFNLRSSNAFIAFNEEVECMCLNKKKFLDLCEMFPNTTKSLKYKAYLRRKEFRRAKLDSIESVEQRTLNKNMSSMGVSYRIKLEETDTVTIPKVKLEETDKSENKKEDKIDVKVDNKPEENPEKKAGDDHLMEIEKMLKEEGAKIEELQKRASLRNLDESVHTQENEEEFRMLLDYAKRIKHQLDKAENQLNHIETEFTKKMKNIKYLIDFISNFEELFITNETKSQNK